MITTTYRRFAIIIPLVFAMGLGATASYAEVSPAPEHPGQHNVVANTTAEHTTAAEHHKKTADYHHGMAEHHKSLAHEHKQLGHKKLAEHHASLAKHHEALAKEHAAIAKVHEEHAAKGK